MRHSLLLLVLAMTVTAGCTVRAPPPSDTECGTGIEAIFMTVRSYGGPTPSQVTDRSLDRKHSMFFVRGHYAEGSGSGNVETGSASLHGLAPEEVKREMQRADFYDAARDFHVQVAWRHALSFEEFDSICDHAGAAFFRLEESYDDPGASECGWTEIFTSTQRGEQRVEAACDAAPDAFDQLKARFLGVGDDARQRAGAPP